MSRSSAEDEKKLFAGAQSIIGEIFATTIQ